jgi:hypothetical protein
MNAKLLLYERIGAFPGGPPSDWILITTIFPRIKRAHILRTPPRTRYVLVSKEALEWVKTAAAIISLWIEVT